MVLLRGRRTVPGLRGGRTVIRAVRIAGFKCFVESTEIRFAPLTLLEGPNGTGKSTLLEALLLLRQTIEHPPTGPWLALHGPLAQLRADEVSTAPDTVVEVDHDNYDEYDDYQCAGTVRYRLVCRPDPDRDPAGLFVAELSRGEARAVATPSDDAEEYALVCGDDYPGPPLFLLDHPQRDGGPTWAWLRGVVPRDECVRHPPGTPFGPLGRSPAAMVAASALGERLARGDFPAATARERHLRERAVESFGVAKLAPGLRALLQIASARSENVPPDLPADFLPAAPPEVRSALADGAHLLDLDEVAARAARMDSLAPMHFERIAGRLHMPSGLADTLDLDDLAQRILRLPSRLAGTLDIGQLARRILHLGALRPHPRLVHDDVPVDRPGDLGPDGGSAVAFLHRHRDDPVQGRAPPGERAGVRPLAEAVDGWLRHLRLARGVVVEPVPPSGLALRHRPWFGPDRTVPADPALSHVLPLLVLGLAADPGDMLLCEHPELHVGAESRSAVFDFLAALANRGVQVVAETRSRELLEAAQRRVADDPPSPSNRTIARFDRDRSGTSSVLNMDLHEAVDRPEVEPGTAYEESAKPR